MVSAAAAGATRPLDAAGAGGEGAGTAVPAVFKILDRHGLKPHRVKTFKVSCDPGSGLKVRDVVGLCVDPPDRAVVLSVDEKTQIQALGRTQKPLPMKPGHTETRTHDRRRSGTACLMAALDVATGKVTGQMTGRRRPQEFPAFPGRAAGGIAPGTPVHVIPGSVSPRKSAEVHEWQKENPDWTFHFTPTSASWMNAVEGFFSKLSRQRLRHAVFNPLGGCVAAIEGYMSITTPAAPARSAGAGSPRIPWKRGNKAAGSCRKRHREKESDH